jgi:dihydrofolate reductase
MGSWSVSQERFTHEERLLESGGLSVSRLRFNITMSLDGYVAGPNQSLAHPLGEGGEKLHEWIVGLRSFRERHGKEGGATGPDDAILAESMNNIGATIMGRHMFGGGDGPWGDDSWKGWWGPNPPFHTPVFVLTHYPLRRSPELTRLCLRRLVHP